MGRFTNILAAGLIGFMSTFYPVESYTETGGCGYISKQKVEERQELRRLGDQLEQYLILTKECSQTAQVTEEKIYCSAKGKCLEETKHNPLSCFEYYPRGHCPYPKETVCNKYEQISSDFALKDLGSTKVKGSQLEVSLVSVDENKVVRQKGRLTYTFSDSEQAQKSGEILNNLLSTYNNYQALKDQ